MNTLVPVTFRFPGSLVPRARRVTVVGPFNGWRGNSHRLTRIPGGDWIITVFLPPGRVVYGFDVDGTRWPDPRSGDRISTGPGSDLSVRHVDLDAGAPEARFAPTRGEPFVPQPLTVSGVHADVPQPFILPDPWSDPYWYPRGPA